MVANKEKRQWMKDGEEHKYGSLMIVLLLICNSVQDPEIIDKNATCTIELNSYIFYIQCVNNQLWRSVAIKLMHLPRRRYSHIFAVQENPFLPRLESRTRQA